MSMRSLAEGLAGVLHLARLRDRSRRAPPGITDLPAWIRRDIGLAGSDHHNGKEMAKWHGWSM